MKIKYLSGSGWGDWGWRGWRYSQEGLSLTARNVSASRRALSKPG
jgi:hypothetical protein